MTLQEAREILRNELEDEGITYYTDVDLNRAILEGYQTTNSLVPFYEEKAEMDIFPGKTYYNFYEIFPNYYHITACWLPSRKIWLANKSYLTFFDYNPRWETSSMPLSAFAVYDFQWIAFLGRPAEPTKIEVYYKAKTRELTDHDIFMLLEANVEPTIVNYAKADLLAQAQQYGKALGGVEGFYNGVDKLAGQFYNRSGQNHVPQMRQQFGTPSVWGE